MALNSNVSATTRVQQSESWTIADHGQDVVGISVRQMVGPPFGVLAQSVVGAWATRSCPLALLRYSTHLIPLQNEEDTRMLVQDDSI